MEKTIVATGKTIDAAVEAALATLGLERENVSVQVLQQAKAGFLGFGAQPAKVQVTYEAPDEPKKPEAPKSALGSASRSKPKVNNPAPAPAPKAEPKKEEPKKEEPKKPEAPKQPKAERPAKQAKSEPKKETPKAPKQPKV